ncbi:MAG: hypothetical protein FJY86_04585, partial [Candidatus Diapherotrites archaeon]|nr:hypothetical protein [Candidatus Diapherotrites archaeon]
MRRWSLVNNKGQAFSTFQLLIAAVVALAILVLLLNIIGGLPNFGSSEPLEEAATLIKGQVNSPSELRTGSNPITFTKEDSLNPKAIADKSGVVTANQVCISLGDFLQDDGTDFAEMNETAGIVKYTGSGQFRVRLSVICDTGTELAEDLTNNGIEDDWLQSTKCQDVSSLSQT